MSTAQERDLTEWLDTSVAFSNHKGVHKKRLEKRQRQFLARFPQIESFLESGEKVWLITSCCSPTPVFEQLTTGWVVFYLNRALLVFTDRRVLHVLTTPAYQYRNSIAQIRYEDCRDIKVRGRSLVVRYLNGSKERFLYLGGKERARIREFCKGLEFDKAGETLGDRTRTGRGHLCPRCTERLGADDTECHGCRLPFKDMGTAIRLSLLLPGGGYFYTRHPLLGIGDFLVEAVLLWLVIESAAKAMSGGGNEAWLSAAFMGIVLILEKLVTIYHARRYIREYIPRHSRIQMASAAT